MITVSWTLINNWLICPFKVKHDLDNVQCPISWPMAYASAGHKALAAWAKDEDHMAVFERECLLYERRTARQKNWNGEFLNPGGGMIDKMQIKHLLKEYTSTVEEKPHRDSVELSLTRDLGDDVILTGRIDAIWPTGAIVDWKFTRNPTYLSPLQPLIYAILNGGPSEFEYHAMVKTRSPYFEPIPVPETEKQENLDRVTENLIKPIAFNIQAAIDDPKLWQARPQEFLCKPEYCSYFASCEAHFV